jgi:hypothetical protein
MYRQNQSGSAMLLAMVVLVGLSAACLSYYSLSAVQIDENVSRESSMRAMVIAEAGLNVAIRDLRDGLDGNIPQTPFAAGTYETVTIDNGDGTFTLYARGVYGDTDRIVGGTVAATSSALFTMAAFGIDDMSVDSNGMTDSFDADLGTYDSQLTGMYKGQGYARTNGGIGSNMDTRIDSNGKVFGDATAGPTGTVSTDSNTHVTGVIGNLPSPRVFDPVVLPAGYSGWANPAARSHRNILWTARDMVQRLAVRSVHALPGCAGSDNVPHNAPWYRLRN